ncbi:class I SAM-dependent methyltransferase [Pasteurella skyensis]|uniref:Class I SAM-dependent methyltransferase n=1 Tax=Phocoenobacter skyensis TaxID=97481 RepID=A0AAJ6NDI8_9PAST|nr:class I SAM-dependent methyltransferase [Pasteurella skyensis]MDP8170603.1 class I SAM-dependent methyltransferase [Pasteurella skyensis]MDP8174760.1 class I SAM-dependent methyltransferase [Pasteurella skyensis]
MKDIISDTLFLPLYFRALDAKKSQSILNDPIALELSQQFEFDTDTLDNAHFSRAGTIARAKFFDDFARDFIRNNPNPVIVNMAAGLDSKTLRIWDEKAAFFDIDLPDVIELRKKYIQDKSTLIAADAFKFDYFEPLLKYENAQFCFIFEGFFMYFDKKEIKPLIENITQHFNGLLLGDFAFGNTMQKTQKRHDAAKNIAAKFKVGFDDIDEILQINPKLHLKQQKYFYEKEFAHLFGWRRYLMMLIPKMGKAMSLLALEF